ncbi:MAG: hypothetical protein EOO61_10415 [Hymenobacter sp.]|nr:MAG: hypothetical protein EOO61_10415 [Hymenobacter sp.]
MYVSVRGWEDAKEAALIEEYVVFCLGVLLPDVVRFMAVHVEVVADQSLLVEKLWGEARCLAWFDTTPTHFRLRVRRSGVSFHDQLKTVGHECTHIGQYHREALVHLGGPLYRWEGEEVNTEEIDDWFEPWERDARANEKALLELYIRDHLGYSYNRRPDWYEDRP